MVELSDKDIEKLKNTLPTKIGERIKQFRQQKRITQAELGRATNKDRQYIYKIEKGKVTPNIVTIAILLKTIGITFQEFFQEDFY